VSAPGPSRGGTVAARMAGGGVRVALPHGGALSSRLPAKRAARRDVSPTIVYSLIMATTLVSFWDLLLLGTHVHT